MPLPVKMNFLLCKGIISFIAVRSDSLNPLKAIPGVGIIFVQYYLIAG